MSTGKRRGRNRKTHRTAVVLIPPRSVWGPIQAIREKHDSHIWRWMPHVTLIYPFRPRNRFDEAEELLEEALTPVAPITVRLARIRYFHHGMEQYTLWLDPEPHEPLRRLQARLGEVFPDCNDVADYPKGFTPHLSVGQVQGRSRRAKTQAALELAWKPIEFTLRDVTLIHRGRTPEDIFRIHGRVPFGG